MGNKIMELARAYERFCSLPWERSLAGAQRVWFAVYSAADERRLRAHIGEFEVVTKSAGHSWHLIDLTDSFGKWIAAEDYRDSYFERPADLELLLPAFCQYVSNLVVDLLTSAGADENSVVAIQGVACLFGLAKVSEVISKVAPSVCGRLLVFFPGEHEGNNYRLLDARDGWNYLAIPITAQS